MLGCVHAYVRACVLAWTGLDTVTLKLERQYDLCPFSAHYI